MEERGESSSGGGSIAVTRRSPEMGKKVMVAQFDSIKDGVGRIYKKV